MRPRRPRRSTRPGCSGVILGDGRGAGAIHAQVERRLRLGRRARAAPALGRGGQARRVRRAAPAAARLAGRRSGGPATRRPYPGARPARRARAAPDHRRRRATTGQDAGAAAAVPRRTPPATPTSRGPGSPRGGRCWPRPSTSTRRRCAPRRSPPSGSARAPTSSSPGSPTGSRLAVDAAQLVAVPASPRWC